jgi:hypothetical protein
LPGETNTRLEILGGCRQRLPVVSQAEVERKVGLNMERILNKGSQ